MKTAAAILIAAMAIPSACLARDSLGTFAPAAKPSDLSDAVARASAAVAADPAEAAARGNWVEAMGPMGQVSVDAGMMGAKPGDHSITAVVRTREGCEAVLSSKAAAAGTASINGIRIDPLASVPPVSRRPGLGAVRAAAPAGGLAGVCASRTFPAGIRIDVRKGG